MLISCLWRMILVSPLCQMCHRAQRTRELHQRVMSSRFNPWLQRTLYLRHGRCLALTPQTKRLLQNKHVLHVSICYRIICLTARPQSTLKGQWTWVTPHSWQHTWRGCHVTAIAPSELWASQTALREVILKPALLQSSILSRLVEGHQCSSP